MHFKTYLFYITVCSSLLLSLTTQAEAQNDFYFVESISRKEGLSHSEVKQIYRDSRGYMWFGTYDGLNRYNAYHCENKNFEGADKSNSNHLIFAIYEDNHKNLWVGASNYGVYKYNIVNDISKLYKFNENLGHANLHIYDIEQDQQGKLWFATSHGLFYYSKDTDKIEKFTTYPYLSQRIIHCLQLDNEDNLWLGSKDYGVYKLTQDTLLNYFSDVSTPTFYSLIIDDEGVWAASFGGGLFYMDKRTESVKRYNVFNSIEGSTDNLINHLIPWTNNRLLLGTYNGIVVFNKTTEQFTCFSSKEKFSQHPQKLPVYNLFLDNENMLWAATKGHGVYKFYLNNHLFNSIHLHPGHENPLNKIHCMERTKGNYILGTENGLVLTGQDFNITNNIRINSGIQEEIITKIEKINDDLFLIGTWNHGMHKFIPSLNTITEIEHPELKKARIYDIHYDGSFIWVGLHEKGMLKMNKAFKLLENLREINKTHKIKSVKKILIDHKGHLWIGSQMQGVEVLDTQSLQKLSGIHNGIEGSWMPELDVLSIFQDSHKNIWIGTNGGGLYLFDYEKHEFYDLNKRKGLKLDVVFSINEDEQGAIWIQSNTGISRYVYYTENDFSFPLIKNYEIKEGLPNTNFFFCQSFKENPNYIYFPSKEGIIKLNTDKHSTHAAAPVAMIHSININNKPIYTISNKYVSSFPEITSDVSNIEKIELNYAYNRLNFEFTALNYYNSDINQYLVKLEGVDNDWVYLSHNRHISYHNLKPGTYLLKLRVANNHNVWNLQGKELTIVIHKPWYFNGLSISVYTMLLLVSLYIFRQITIKKQAIKNKRVLEKVKMENEKKLALYKLDFFTKITHEIRTPITLIKGPVEKMLNESEGTIPNRRYLEIIKSNSDKLHHLTNQILDLRKIDEQKMTLNKIKADVVPFLKEIVERFKPFADTKSIQLIFFSEVQSFRWFFDAKVIDQICSNLLSNAIKFTPDFGQVKLKFEIAGTETAKKLNITVEDTGIGIDSRYIDKIFTPFYQIEKPEDKNTSLGTGLGLSLVKEFSELHEGNLKVYSEPGKGTRFIVSFTFQSTKNEQNTPQTEKEDIVLKTLEAGMSLEKRAVNNNATSILIVEDNIELNEFLTTLLMDEYKILNAYNGLDGYEKAVKYLPDLVISDLMMPKMHGNEFCEKLKSNHLTCHIPFIMLTIKNNESSQLESLFKGADDYIFKPFNSEILLVKIKNLLLLKEQLRHLFMKNFFIKEHDDADNLPFDPIIANTVKYIEENLDDISIPKLISGIGIGRSQFYLKIKNTTGMSVNELIQSIRLKNAYTYLANDDYNISEVAYKVGFKNLSHFSKSFKAKFGKAPSDVLHTANKNV